MERWHHSLFAQVRSIRFQWADHLGIEPHQLPAQATPWIVQHASFICNRFLIKSSGFTSNGHCFGREWKGDIDNFGAKVFGDIGARDHLKLQHRNADQKLQGIWIGRDIATGLHLLALPAVAHSHPGVHGHIFRCRTITVVPVKHRFDLVFTSSVAWPQFELTDHIEENIMQRFQLFKSENITLQQHLNREAQQHPHHDCVPPQPQAVVPRPPPGRELPHPHPVVPAVPPPVAAQPQHPPFIPAPPPLKHLHLAHLRHHYILDLRNLLNIDQQASTTIALLHSATSRMLISTTCLT